MSMWSFTSRSEEDDDNAAFARVLRAWLETKGIDTEPLTGAIMVLQTEDGFDVVQLSDRAYSDGQLALYMQHVAEHMRAAMARLN